ncbi:MAG: FAD-binding oxidoreductase [Sphingobacteriales bacterium]|nr:MAG: FAD-binding oxidoreductase [Sphingobacteriales bacterium]
MSEISTVVLPELRSSRRSFLKQGGLLAAGLAVGLPWFGGCRKSATEADGIWNELANSLQGSLLRSDYSGFAQKAAPWALQYAAVLPQGIASCASVQDVQTCVRWAQKHSVPFVARSGGHSYGGYSTTTGLMIDLSPMNQIRLEPATGYLSAEGGARNQQVFDRGRELGYSVTHGRCFQVGVGGLTLGGGIGFDMRENGYTCDKLVETEVVLASGERITCNETQNSDLFWACRGAGGGNFGIHTSFTFQPFRISNITVFDIRWKGGDTAGLLRASQQMIANLPNELGMKLSVTRTKIGPNEPLSVAILGSYSAGNRTALEQLLRPMLAVQTPDLTDIRETNYWDGNTFLSEDGTPEYSHERSRFVSNYLTEAAIATIIDQMNAWPGTSRAATWKFFLLGGAIDAKRPDAMAMVHRGHKMLSSIELEWNPQDNGPTLTAAQQWLDRFYLQMVPFASAHCYQNFIDPSETDYLNAYYGSNLERLRQVKRKYDPQNVFRYPQSIPL